jgi:hypothetical protein
MRQLHFTPLGTPSRSVMAGLVPAIHVFFWRVAKGVDAQHKAGHDGGEADA